MAILNNAPVIIGGSDSQQLYLGEMPAQIPETKEKFKTECFKPENKVSYVAEVGDIDESKEKKEVPGLWQTTKENRVSRKKELADLEATIYVTDDEYVKYKGYFDNNKSLIVGAQASDEEGEPVIQVGFAAQISKCVLTNVGKDNEFLTVKLTISPSGDLLDLKDVGAEASAASQEDPEQGE